MCKGVGSPCPMSVILKQERAVVDRSFGTRQKHSIPHEGTNDIQMH